MISETPAETLSIELSTLERSADRVSLRARHALRDGSVDSGSQRPMREILAKYWVDCSGRRVATLSRAVFSDNDAMISHQAVRPAKAAWREMDSDDPLYKRACGPS